MPPPARSEEEEGSVKKVLRPLERKLEMGLELHSEEDDPDLIVHIPYVSADPRRCVLCG